ncbi:SgcJ/EcaC family oxidoreductase [Aliivibrio kagoshimensis]|uniref:SgcJ/EcaC family oxidoreductase n=1 Tax=Aliivibrio kagoshimensis TaxID=2910230 RepID=UPI003D0F2EA6
MSTKEIIDNMNRWVSSFSEKETDDICALYDEDASLLGTLSPINRDSAELIREYFEQIFQYQHRYVEFGTSNIRLFGDIAISNGQYTFRWFNEEEVTVVARFSFVYVKKGERWMIIEHHSSIMPIASW